MSTPRKQPAPFGTYSNLSSTWIWERVGITVYGENITTGKKTTFSSVAELKRYADTGRRD